MAVPMFGVLTGATILLFTALRTDLALSGPESYALLGAYVPVISPTPIARRFCPSPTESGT